MKFVSVDIPYIENKYFKEIERIDKVDSVKVFEDNPTNSSEIIERIRDSELVTADIVTKLSSEVILNCPNIRAIFCQAVGYDNVDIETASSKGIKVFNCAGFNARAVAEFAFALITSLLRKIPAAQEHVRAGGWSYNFFIGSELYNKRVGIIGSGNVAKYISKIAYGYDMKVSAYTKEPTLEKAKSMGIDKFESIEDILSNSDIIILAVPLNKGTFHLIGEQEIALMKKNAILVNVARYSIVDEIALAKAVIGNKIAGAVMDMMIEEPFNVNDYSILIKEVIRLPNFIVTPHIAGVSEESRSHLGKMFVNNIKNFIDGNDSNCVNLELLANYSPKENHKSF